MVPVREYTMEQGEAEKQKFMEVKILQLDLEAE